jgi:hypothetical protein
MDRPAAQPDRFFLWVDAVGGYLVCLGDMVTLGQAADGPEAADIPLLGDLSRQHARIRRDGEGYLIEGYKDISVDGRPVAGVAGLRDGSLVRLGRGVKLVFRRPHALSATARLDFVSGHRTQPTVDAVLLMADTCVLGPQRHSHVVCREWPGEVVLSRHEEQLYCRAAGAIEIDGGRYTSGRGPVGRNSRIMGERFSLTLEEIRTR